MMIPKFLVQLSLVVVLTACTNLPTSVTTTTYSPNHASTSEVDHTATQLPEPTATPSPSPSPNPTSTQTPEPTPTPNQVELAKEQAASSLGNSANWEINTLFYDGQIIGELNQDGKLVISIQGETSEIFQHNISINQLAIDETDLYVNGYEDVKGFGFYAFGYDREGGWKALDTTDISAWTKETQNYFNSYSRDDKGLTSSQIAENDAQDERFDKMMHEARKVRATQIQEEDAQLYQEIINWMAQEKLLSSSSKQPDQMNSTELLTIISAINAQQGKSTILTLGELRLWAAEPNPVISKGDYGWFTHSSFGKRKETTARMIFGKSVVTHEFLTDSAIGDLFAYIQFPGSLEKGVLLGIKDTNSNYRFSIFVLPNSNNTSNDYICVGNKTISGEKIGNIGCPTMDGRFYEKTTYAQRFSLAGQFEEKPVEATVYNYLEWSKDTGFKQVLVGLEQQFQFESRVDNYKITVLYITHNKTGLIFVNAIAGKYN